MNISDLDKSMLRRIVSDLQNECGDRLEDVLLFGSYAKGTAKPDSDIDILVILSGSLDELEDFENFPDTSYETMWSRYNLLIHCCVSSRKDYTNRRHKELRDVPEYGISIFSL